MFCAVLYSEDRKREDNKRKKEQQERRWEIRPLPLPLLTPRVRRYVSGYRRRRGELEDNGEWGVCGRQAAASSKVQRIQSSNSVNHLYLFKLPSAAAAAATPHPPYFPVDNGGAARGIRYDEIYALCF